MGKTYLSGGVEGVFSILSPSANEETLPSKSSDGGLLDNSESSRLAIKVGTLQGGVVGRHSIGKEVRV